MLTLHSLLCRSSANPVPVTIVSEKQDPCGDVQLNYLDYVGAKGHYTEGAELVDSVLDV